jgi:multiple sugar transport system permease protein
MTSTQPHSPPASSAQSGKPGWLSKQLVLAVGAVLIIIFSLAPVMWELLTSIKTNEAITADPLVYFPSWSQYTLQHYWELLVQNQFYIYVFNSALVAIVSTVLCLCIGAPAAYALTRLHLPGERIILGVVLVVTLFPYILLFLGLLEIVRAVGLANNYLALIIPYTAINLPLTILTMRSFFQQMPRDLEDSAKIDGYSILGMLVKIILPLTLPALVTTGILAFIFAWNEYIFALTFITRETMKTIPVAAAQLAGTTLFDIPYGPLAAATITGTLPLIFLVLFFQRKIVQGLTAGSVKG